MSDVGKTIRECIPWFVDMLDKKKDEKSNKIRVSLPFVQIDMDERVAKKWKQKWLMDLSDCTSHLAVLKLSCLLEKHRIYMLPAYLKDAECNGLTLYIPLELASKFIPVELIPAIVEDAKDILSKFPGAVGKSHPVLTTLLAAAFAMTVCTSGNVKTGERFYECVFRHGFEGFRECLDVAREEGVSILRELWKESVGFTSIPPPRDINEGHVLAIGTVLLRTGFNPFADGGGFSATYSPINHMIGGLPYLASKVGGEASITNVIGISGEEAERLRGFGDAGCGIYSLTLLPAINLKTGENATVVALTLPVHAATTLAAALYRLLEKGGLDARDPELEKAIPWLVALSSSHEYHFTCDELEKLVTGTADEIRRIAEKKVARRFEEMKERYGEWKKQQEEWEDIKDYI